MTSLLPSFQSTEVFYLSSDGEPLQLRLQIEGQLIGFYREDTGEKLLIPEEFVEALKQERLAREQAQAQVERLKEHLRRREAACR
ncbi:hypothetical protein [Nostoc sp. C052]|uniref:hypothetical protein n=1 Tax=Nostoc sp. C052 TaxID=2576902 RepID=UPI003569D2FE